MTEWMRRSPGPAFVAVFAAVTVISEALMWYGLSVLPGGDSRQGVITSDAIVFIGYITVPVLAFVVTLLLFAMTVWRVPDSDTEAGAHQLRTHRGMTMTWLAATLALAVLVTVYPGITGIEELSADAKTTPGTLVVDVTAQQWEWSFAYPQYHVKYSGTLVLPVNRKVKFVLTSKDVMHSFWVPAMGVKDAVIPGETRTLYLTPDKIASTAVDPRVRVQCAQICGIGHAQMWAQVRVIAGSAFGAWAKKQSKVSVPMG